MKKILCSLIATILLLSSFLCLCSCEKKQYKIYTSTPSGNTMWLDVDPFDVDAGSTVFCKRYSYSKDGELLEIGTAYIESTYSSIPDNKRYRSDEGLYVTVRVLGSEYGFVYDFDESIWRYLQLDY